MLKFQPSCVLPVDTSRKGPGQKTAILFSVRKEQRSVKHPSNSLTQKGVEHIQEIVAAGGLMQWRRKENYKASASEQRIEQGQKNGLRHRSLSSALPYDNNSSNNALVMAQHENRNNGQRRERFPRNKNFGRRGRLSYEVLLYYCDIMNYSMIKYG